MITDIENEFLYIKYFFKGFPLSTSTAYNDLVSEVEI
jgi:hypothetical protein